MVLLRSKIALALSMLLCINLSAKVQELKNSKELETLQKNNPGKHVALKAHAPWCGYCKKLKAEYEKMSEEFPDIIFVALENEKGKDLFQKNNITGMPTVLIYEAGSQVATDKVVGYNPNGLRIKLQNLSNKKGAPAPKMVADAQPEEQKLTKAEMKAKRKAERKAKHMTKKEKKAMEEQETGHGCKNESCGACNSCGDAESCEVFNNCGACKK